MKKLIINFVMALCLILPSAFIFGACGGNAGAGSISSMSKTELVGTFKSIALNSWQQLGAGDPTTQSTSAETSNIYVMNIGRSNIPNEMTEQTADNTVFYIKEAGATMMAYIYMLGEYYENEDFVISDKVVNFTVEVVDPNSNETYTSVLSFLPKVFKDDNRVVVEMFLQSKDMQSLGYSDTNSYYYFDIGYDFKNSKLLSFYLLNIQYNIKNSGENHEEFTEMGIDEEGKYFGNETLSNNFKNACKDVFNEFVNKKDNGLTLSGNFDAEFNRYGERANQACKNMEKTRA